jgi:hypothetical protein
MLGRKHGMRSDWLFLDSFETQPDRPDRVSFETSTLEAPGIDIVS